MYEPENLDGFTEADLLVYHKVYQLLAHYCEDKHRAMVMRREGYIEEALSAEASCEAIYQRLPEWARW
jgi:hypothetical protein